MFPLAKMFLMVKEQKLSKDTSHISKFKMAATKSKMAADGHLGKQLMLIDQDAFGLKAIVIYVFYVI